MADIGRLRPEAAGRNRPVDLTEIDTKIVPNYNHRSARFSAHRYAENATTILDA